MEVEGVFRRAPNTNTMHQIKKKFDLGEGISQIKLTYPIPPALPFPHTHMYIYTYTLNTCTLTHERESKRGVQRHTHTHTHTHTYILLSL